MTAFSDEQRLAQIIELGLDTPDGSDLRLLCEAFIALQAALARVEALPCATVDDGSRWIALDDLHGALDDQPEQVQSNAPGHESRACVDDDVPGEDCDCPVEPSAPSAVCQAKDCGRPLSEHEYGMFCP